MTAGYARLSLKSAFHLFATWEANDFFLIPACRRQLMLRSEDAKLKKRAELPAGAWICAGCERKENAS